jgi:hypothetical protein
MSDRVFLSYRDYEPSEEGRAQVVRKIHFKAHGTFPARVPPRVAPDDVEAALSEELKKGLRGRALMHAADVARFYRVESAVEHFVAQLNRRERDGGELYGSLCAACAVADLGSPAQAEQAGSYYLYILRQNAVDDFCEAAVEAFFDFDASVTQDNVAEALDRRIAAQKGRPGDAARDVEETLRMHREQTLPAVAEGRDIKLKMLAEPKDEKRTAALAAVYSGMEEVASDGRVWGTYALRDELRRSSDEIVVAGFQATAARKLTAGEADDQDRIRAAIARAIVYFGGSLTEEQKVWLKPEILQPYPLEG